MAVVAREIRIEGVVQGVGFRPFVFRLAQEYGIKGWVLNSSEGVMIWAEAPEETVNSFYQAVLAHPPKLAMIVRHSIKPRQLEGFDRFFIKHSERSDHKEVLISPDVSTCEDCYREIMDPHDRRYHYPFTNCTNCGPRFTIIMDVPYDREKTTMRDFPMCSLCAHEFEDPMYRRFHAQPNCCPECGPQVTLMDLEGNTYQGLGQEFLKEGKILAVKGLGGFHLVCDATNREAVISLRQRKIREFKPFAVMCRDLETVKEYCFLSPQEAELLESPAHPIVILERRVLDNLPPEIAPGITTLGVMLPYTPLHHLLFDQGLKILVMTSANISDDPLIIDNEEAFKKLKGIADYFLVHNRQIYNRCDDSVAAVVGGEVQIYRRARGYVPLPVDLPVEPPAVILGCGGELKNTFCMTRGKSAYLSQHLGDINHYGNYQQFLYTIPRFETMLDVKPEVVVYDLHPEYMATRWAKSLKGVKKVGVQHHQAHLASCLAENLVTAPALGVVCDGTGYGLDGAIWGFEFFAGTPAHLERMAHLDYLPLPGEITIKRPARMALTYLYELFGDKGLRFARSYLPSLPEEEQQILIRQLENRLNTVPTSSCGRLFDAVSALLGICTRVQYEGQAAIELETAASMEAEDLYSFELSTAARPYRLGVRGIFEGILKDLKDGVPAAESAGRFHRTIGEMITAVLKKLREETGISLVALSGGVFQNKLLFLLLCRRLAEEGFEVFYHKKVPTNDGGVALGQVYIASEVIRENVSCHSVQDLKD
jgi:hydrogenase maturation protein HypF